MKMMKSKIFGLFILLMACMPLSAFAGTCSTGDPFPYEAPYDIDHCPEDIQNWLDRANTCAHFVGEEAYDEERKRELDNVLNENQCDYIECDFFDLFAHYEGDIIYTKILTDYEGLLTGGQGYIDCQMEREMPPEERVGDEYLMDSE